MKKQVKIRLSKKKNFQEIKFEFTSLGNPQQNGMLERIFATLHSVMCVMMTQVGLHENLRTGIWPDCAATATKLENIMVNPHKNKCSHENFYGKILDYTIYLRTLVEMLVVRSIAMLKAKLEYLVKTGMFLCYAQNNTGSTYCMLNLRIKRIVLRHDVISFKNNYGEYLSRKYNTNLDSYILQNEDESYKWYHVKIDPVKNEINTEDVKTEKNVNTKQDINSEEDV